MIYLDNASTTRVFDEVIDEVSDAMSGGYFNPSALYRPAGEVRQRMERARDMFAGSLGCGRNEVYFTSCATESNNWALNCGFKNKKGNIITTMGEHPSVFETASSIKNRGYDVRFAKLEPDGRVSADDLLRLVDKDTCLISVMHASNEIGAINDIRYLSKVIREKAPKAIIHSDGVQAFCKITVNVEELGVDMYSLSAHKIGAPKGVGLLYINKKLSISTYMSGGGQEREMRSGTENIPGILGFAKAVEIYKKKCNAKQIAEIRKFFIKELMNIEGIVINGAESPNTGYVLSASVAGIKGEILQHILSEKGILIGLGSACSSRSKHNRILSSIGRSPKEVEGSIRLSFGPDTQADDIAYAASELTKNIKLLREKING